MVSQVVGAECPRKVVNMALPDAPVITGTSKEVFEYYGLNAEGIVKKAKRIAGIRQEISDSDIGTWKKFPACPTGRDVSGECRNSPIVRKFAKSVSAVFIF